MSVYLKLFSFLWSLFIFNSAIAQSTYIVGQPVNDSLGALGWNSNGNCFANDWADFTLHYVDCDVTGLSYVFILTEVSPANSVYTDYAGIINTGDTLLLDGFDHSFYFPETSFISGTFKIIGTPQVEGEVYSCGEITGIHTLSECSNAFVYSVEPYNYVQCVVQPACYSEQTEIITACESFTFNDIIYTETGTYTHEYLSVDGCDSIVSLDLTILHQIDSTIVVSACESYTLNGETYTESGQYFKSFTNSLGCDSLNLTINLEINHADEISITETSCDTYTFNNETYTETGIYNQMFTSSAGCDSIVSLDLTIKQSSSNSITATACDDYFINHNVYDESGVYTIMLENSVGCDSVVTLNLTIEEIDVTVEFVDNTLFATEDATSYQWIDCMINFELIDEATNQSFECIESGVYAVIITKGGCSATSECIEVLANLNESYLGVENQNINSSLNIYPNPNSGHFKVEFGGIQMPVSLRVHDVLGRVIEQIDQYNGSSYEFNLPQVQGVYFVSLYDSKGQGHTKKFVIR